MPRELIGGLIRVALAALAVLTPGAACAVAPPDSGLRAVLGVRCDSADFVRVVTGRSTRMVRQLKLEADAVVLPGLGRVALIQLGEQPESRGTRIPWSDVESLATGESRTAQGLVRGALLGLAVGGGLVALNGPDVSEHGDNVVLFAGVALGLTITALGALLGAANPQWHPLYP
jgi:hypothetical protein